MKLTRPRVRSPDARGWPQPTIAWLTASARRCFRPMRIAHIAPRQAIDRGFKDAAPMKNAADLEPSWSREDFPKLLAEVVSKAKP